MAHDIPGDGRRRGPDLSRTRETDYRGSRRREFSGSGERGYPVARDREYPGVPERESSAFHDRGYYERGRHGSRDGDPFRDSDSDAHERSFRGSDRGTRDERGESPPSDWPLESRDTFGAGYPGSGSYDGQSESLRTRPEAPERATAAGRHGGTSPTTAPACATSTTGFASRGTSTGRAPVEDSGANSSGSRRARRRVT